MYLQLQSISLTVTITSLFYSVHFSLQCFSRESPSKFLSSSFLVHKNTVRLAIYLDAATAGCIGPQATSGHAPENFLVVGAAPLKWPLLIKLLTPEISLKFLTTWMLSCASYSETIYLYNVVFVDCIVHFIGKIYFIFFATASSSKLDCSSH